MPSPLYLGVDLGTSYFKVGLFDGAGVLQGLGRVAVETQSPAPGRRELSICLFWHLLRRGLSQALTQARADAGQIAGVSYSSQANTFVLLDKWDSPITPLVLWTDARAEPVDPALADFSSTEEFARTAGFSGWTGAFAVAKCRWFKETEPELWARTRRVMTLADYFTFALTGEHVGDAGTAAFLGLLDVDRGRWWPKALRAAGLESGRLSKPLPPGAVAGRTRAAAADFLGLPAGLPVAVGGLDHQVAALGSGLGRFADASISTGTVLAAMTLVREIDPRPGCFHGRHFGDEKLYRLAFDPDGAGQLEAYQRDHAPDYSIDALADLAASAPPGILPANPVKREADFEGMHGDSVRFLMEKISVSHRRLLRRVAGGTPIRRIVATGGGTRSPLWLQIKADVLELPVVTPAAPERACLGAAMLAAAAAGAYAGVAEAAERMFKPGREYHPDPEQVAFYRVRFPEAEPVS